jgi:hypothetical protein
VQWGVELGGHERWLQLRRELQLIVGLDVDQLHQLHQLDDDQQTQASAQGEVMAAPSGRVYSAYDRLYAKTDNVKQAERMRARRAAVKRYGAAALKGKDLDHIRPLQAGGTNQPSNWRIRSVHANRGDKTVFTDPGYHPTRV